MPHRCSSSLEVCVHRSPTDRVSVVEQTRVERAWRQTYRIHQRRPSSRGYRSDLNLKVNAYVTWVGADGISQNSLPRSEPLHAGQPLNRLCVPMFHPDPIRRSWYRQHNRMRPLCQVRSFEHRLPRGFESISTHRADPWMRILSQVGVVSLKPAGQPFSTIMGSAGQRGGGSTGGSNT